MRPFAGYKASALITLDVTPHSTPHSPSIDKAFAVWRKQFVDEIVVGALNAFTARGTVTRFDVRDLVLGKCALPGSFDGILVRANSKFPLPEVAVTDAYPRLPARRKKEEEHKHNEPAQLLAEEDAYTEGWPGSDDEKKEATDTDGSDEEPEPKINVQARALLRALAGREKHMGAKHRAMIRDLKQMVGGKF